MENKQEITVLGFLKTGVKSVPFIFPPETVRVSDVVGISKSVLGRPYVKGCFLPF
jgi:hypothetical protein